MKTKINKIMDLGINEIGLEIEINGITYSGCLTEVEK